MTFTSPKTGAAGAARLPDPEDPCRSARAAAVLGEMGGGDLRPDGPHARPRRRLLLRLCGGAGGVRRRRAEVRRQRRRVLRAACATSISMSATRSCRRRSTAASPRTSRAIPTLYAGVVKERDDGIVISGAQQLATGGVLSDWLHLSCIHPLQPGDENYANCLAVPVNAPGAEALSAPAVRAATPTIRSTIRCRAGSTSPTATSCSTTCSCRGSTCSSIATSRSRRDQWWKTPSHALRQPSGAGALRHQAALHDRARAAHERDDRQRAAARRCRSRWASSRRWCRSTRACCSRTRPVAPIKDGVLWPSTMTLYSAMAMQSEFNGRMLEIDPRAGRRRR